MKVAKAINVIGIVIGAHIVAKIVMELFDPRSQYGYEHGYYYLVLLLLSGVIYAHYENVNKTVFTSIPNYFKRENIGIMILIGAFGYYFQALPDIDQRSFEFLGHRSIFTHSIFFIWIYWLVFRQKIFLDWVANNYKKDISLENNKWVKSIFLALNIGITSHLMVDIAYMFKLPPTLFLTAHKGHGYIVGMRTSLDIPFILFMTLISIVYLIHLIKGSIKGPMNLNPFKSMGLLFRRADKGEFLFYSFLALSLLLNISRDFRVRGEFYFEIWVLLFVLIIFVAFVKRVRNAWNQVQREEQKPI